MIGVNGVARVTKSFARVFNGFASIEEGKSQADDTCGRQPCLYYGPPSRAIGGIRSLPLGLKIAGVVLLWLYAWRLIFRGLDRLEGWRDGGRWRGARNIFGGLITGIASIVFWL